MALSKPKLTALQKAHHNPRGLIDDTQAAYHTLNSLNEAGLLKWRGALWPEGTIDESSHGRLFQITVEGRGALLPEG